MIRNAFPVVMFCALAWTSTANAVDPECDGTGLDGAGQCVLDTHAVHWCTDEGAYRVLFCKDGDICAQSVDGGGVVVGYTCIPRTSTECADVPDGGVCASAEVLLWCNGGAVESADCDGDTECGWDIADQEYDCVAKGRLNASEGGPNASSEDAGPEPAVRDSPELFIPGDIAAGGPGPTFQPNAAVNAGDVGGSGCKGGPSSPWSLPIVSLVVALVWLSRRLVRSDTR